MQFSSLRMKLFLTQVIPTYLGLPPSDRTTSEVFERVQEKYPHKKICQVLNSGDLGGHGMSSKRELLILTTYASYVNMQCSTVHCFIAAELLTFSSKENGRSLTTLTSSSLQPFPNHLKTSGSRWSPYVIIVLVQYFIL